MRFPSLGRAALRWPVATVALLLHATICHAAEADDPPVVRRAADDGGPPAVRTALESIVYGGGTDVRDAPANAGNEIARIPLVSGGLQLRPRLSAEHGDWVQLVFRPRLWGRADRTQTSGVYFNERAAGWSIDTFYLQLNPASNVNVAYGRQTFEWGEAAFLNASNRLFHVNALQKDALFVVHGKELARISVFAGRSFSAVALFELRNNGDPTFGPGPFDRKGLIKLEFASESGANRLGLVGGAGQSTLPWLGLYGTAEVREGLSLYTDVALTRGSRALHPLAGADGVEFQPTLSGENRPEVLGVLGGKYTTLAGLELGLEYVANTAGYSRDELRTAYEAASTPSPQLQSNAQSLGNPGLEVLGRNYLYLTLRWPSLIERWDVNVAGGYLFSLTDQSGRGLLYAEGSLAQSLVLFGNIALAHGAFDAELAALTYGSALVGLRHTW